MTVKYNFSLQTQMLKSLNKKNKRKVFCLPAFGLGKTSNSSSDEINMFSRAFYIKTFEKKSS